jgi:S1-C subfamily serine protease
MNALRHCLLLPLLLPLLWGCGPRVLVVDRSPQAYYQTAYPTHDVSREIEEAFRSLRRITYTAEYETYLFTPQSGVTEADLADPAVLQRATERFTDTHSKAGTAVILARSPRRVALVTNNHVVRFPRSQTYFVDEDRERRPRSARRVAAYSVLLGTRGTLNDHPSLGPFDVIARDTARDIAAIEVRLPPANEESFPPLGAPPGDPRRLSWGSFVYVLGYPSGFPMVTRAIVSDPDRDRRGSFLTDGLWNEGISGGPILAIRGDDGAVEWVGLTRAGAGSREVRLQPVGWEPPDDDSGIVYQGPIYAETSLRIQYGITVSVPITDLRSFLAANRELMRRRGYDVRRF